jgi:hypothetical protein
VSCNSINKVKTFGNFIHKNDLSKDNTVSKVDMSSIADELHQPYELVPLSVHIDAKCKGCKEAVQRDQARIEEIMFWHDEW